uniref:protein-S-isoprenylcysteine alpha-carbonyl methylesterase n=1 Tax=Aegilops tauschii subsp. strangulata TaxID=200361 RepID=A0A453F429_AEGTS
VALAVYAILLMPGFLQVGYYYFFSSQVHRSIVYGEQPRNSRLDLYIPKDNRRPCPVVAFVTGGAWIIGYKAWGALLGRRLAERGIIVACIDYRNFPQGRIGDMVSDASQGISFVCNNIASYGGDPNKIYLMGQSAGAHISACALMEQAVKESSGQPISWSVTQIKAYFGLSGGYNIHNLVDHFHQRGLNRSIFLSIMDGEESLSRYSPEIVVKESSARTIALLPHIFLMHGTDDYSIPSSASQTFVDVLQQVGAQAKLLLYEGKTHTDIFIQDPLRGGRDPLVEDVFSIIYADDATRRNTASAPTPRRLVFEWQLQLARWISPF